MDKKELERWQEQDALEGDYAHELKYGLTDLSFDEWLEERKNNAREI